MSFTVAIRGIPDFAHLQYIQVESFQKLFNLYHVRVRSALFTGYRPEVYNKEGRRVMLYINPSEHGSIALGMWHKNRRSILHMRPSAKDTSKLGGAGTGAGSVGDWLYLQPEGFPDYAEAMERARLKDRAEAEARAKAEAEEEARAEVLAEALDNAVQARGYDEVLKTLQDMGA